MITPILREEGIARLRGCAEEAEAYYGRLNDPFGDHFGITGSTFRAYQGFARRPSVIYKEWAATRGRSCVEALAAGTPVTEVHDRVSEELGAAYRERGGRPMSVAERYKLTDLFLKFVAGSKALEERSSRRRVLEHANVPLDRYSLRELGRCTNGLILSRSPSMGNVTTEDDYRSLQERIRTLTLAAGVPNLFFDYLANGSWG